MMESVERQQREDAAYRSPQEGQAPWEPFR